jgi:hypothetical protein
MKEDTPSKISNLTQRISEIADLEIDADKGRKTTGGKLLEELIRVKRQELLEKLKAEHLTVNIDDLITAEIERKRGNLGPEGEGGNSINTAAVVNSINTAAVVIGINDYKVRPLTSAVNDARAFRKALINLDLVPEEQIVLLTSPSIGSNQTRATSKRITDTLYEYYVKSDLDRF